jgi:hypothetical protein
MPTLTGSQPAATGVLTRITTHTVSDLVRVNQWLWQVLHGDGVLASLTGGRVYIDQAPQGVTGLMVVAAFLGGSDKLVTSRRRLTRMLYLVRAISEGSSYDLVSRAADRIEAVLTVPDLGTIIDDVRISTCFREQPHQRRDAESGIPIVYLGGVYRIETQPAFQ